MRAAQEAGRTGRHDDLGWLELVVLNHEPELVVSGCSRKGSWWAHRAPSRRATTSFGEPGVNVLELNLALDKEAPAR